MPGPPTLSSQQAADVLRRGGIIAYPTEAVWGLGCDPFDQFAVSRLLALKQRAVDKGLIVIASTVEQLKPLVDFDALPADRLVAVLATWPGPHTWIMPAEAAAPRWITGAHDGIAVRVSAHPVVVALCQAHGGPLVSTSANPAAQPAPRTPSAIDPTLRAGVDAIVTGNTGANPRPSSIRDARSGASLRD